MANKASDIMCILFTICQHLLYISLNDYAGH